MRVLGLFTATKWIIALFFAAILLACSEEDTAIEKSTSAQRNSATAEGVILACAKRENGQLRIVDDHSQCHSSERPVSWNSEGPTGPAGPRGPQGEQGDCAGCQPSQYRFVGFSNEGSRGTTGVLQLTTYCQDTYAGSRICTSDEVVKSLEFPTINSSASNAGPSAWVVPTAIAGRGASVGFDITTGLQTSTEGLTCAGWSDTPAASSGHTGLTVNDRGQFKLMSCSSNLKVACCAPAVTRREK